jgi:hypothetical protein
LLIVVVVDRRSMAERSRWPRKNRVPIEETLDLHQGISGIPLVQIPAVIIGVAHKAQS